MPAKAERATWRTAGVWAGGVGVTALTLILFYPQQMPETEYAGPAVISMAVVAGMVAANLGWWAGDRLDRRASSRD